MECHERNIRETTEQKGMTPKLVVSQERRGSIQGKGGGRENNF